MIPSTQASRANSYPAQDVHASGDIRAYTYITDGNPPRRPLARIHIPHKTSTLRATHIHIHIPLMETLYTGISRRFISSTRLPCSGFHDTSQGDEYYTG